METDNNLQQWSADSSRLLKIALRQHDPDMLSVAQQRIAERLGPEFAEKATFDMITFLISTENWSFVNPETGEASPLI